MLRKYLTVFLASILTVAMLPAIAISTFAEDSDKAEGNGADAIAEAFGQYQIGQNVVNSSGGIDVPVKLTTYVKDKNAHNSETIFYVINHLEERIGQESDVSILSDYINNNYIVVVADYQNHPNAIASKIEYSIQALRNDISTGKYIGDLKFAASYKSEINFMLPAGYRLARDITYFNLLDHGCKGTAELIVKAWNSEAFKNGKGKLVPACEGNDYKGGWFEATDITQLVRPDKVNGNVAIPLDFDLGLDIVYPSNPTRETPVTVTASSWEQREGVNLGSKAGLFSTALVFRGFTCAVYSHEYYPMARDDHYGYWSGDYGVARYNGVKTHTAAIRCIKYFSEQFGYSADHIGVGGGSKASYCSLLGQEDPELRAELSSYTGTYNDQYGNVAQPWQTYAKSGEKITGQVQTVYTYMGDGTNLHASIVNETTAPTIIACGYYDQFGAWDKWPACQATYMKWDVPHLAITMTDLGHVCPYGQDPDLDYERTQSAADFFDYWLNDAAPKLVYTNPIKNSKTFKGEEPLQIQFTGEFDLSEISSKIKVIDVTANRELSGTWTACAGNTKFEFAGPDYTNGNTYSIVIPETLTDRNGKTIDEGVTRTFVSSADIRIATVKDAYIVNGSNENKGAETVINLVGDTSLGYLEFDITSVKNKTVNTRLALDVTNDAVNIIDVYALAEDAADWQEGSIIWSNAPTASTLVTSVTLSGAGRYMADITDYVNSIEGNAVRLVLVNRIKQGGTIYDVNFDGLSSFAKATGTIENAPYSTYGYRVGGAPAATGLSSEEDHTTGSGKSFKMTRNHDYDRFKLYNTLKTSAMTESDIGTTYRATLWAKSDTAISLTMGVMSPYGDSFGSKFCGTTSATMLVAGEWTKCELIYTITDNNLVKAADGTISEIACLLTVQGSGTSPLYVDDVKVEILSTDVTISSRESGKAPTLYVDANVGVAAIGKTQYASLADAFAAVPTDGTLTTITLNTNTQSSSKLTVAKGQNILLDLNGFTVNLTDASKDGPLTVHGELAVKNGTIKDELGTARRWTVLIYGDKNTKLELLDGAVIDSNADYGTIQLGQNNMASQDGHLIVHDGATVTTGWMNLHANSGGKVTIYGGTFINPVRSYLFHCLGTTSFTADRYIYGGTFTSKVTSSMNYAFVGRENITLMGGTFNAQIITKEQVPVPVADGYMIKETADGRYSVVKAEAKIGTTTYPTIYDALAAVPTDGTLTTITLNKDVDASSKITVAKGQNILLDLGGFTVNLTDTTKEGPITVNGTLAVKNGTIKDELGTARRWTIRVFGDNSIATLELLEGAFIDSNADYGTIWAGKSNNATSVDARIIVRDGATVKTGWLNLHAYTGAEVFIYGGNFINDVRSYTLHFEGNDTFTAERYIYGGNFTANVTDKMWWTFADAKNVTITGGTFEAQLLTSQKAPVAVAPNHEIVENADGTYTVKKIRSAGYPTDFTYISQAEPDKNFGGKTPILLSGENQKNMMVLAEFNTAELANLKILRIPVCGENDQNVSIAVIDGWSFDASTVTYNNVQDKLWEELMTTEKAGKFVGRYTIGTNELLINAEDILSKVSGDVFTLVLQADEKYSFELDFNDRTALSISEGAGHGVIGSTHSINVPYEPTYMAARGGYTAGCKISFVKAKDKNGEDSMMFRVTQGGQRYRFYNLISTDKLTVLDIGRTFRVSFDVMTTVNQSNSLNVGLHCRSNGDGVTSPGAGGKEYNTYAANWRYKDQKITTQANEWITYTFEFTVDELMINHQIGMLCMNFGNIGATEYFYIDNIKAEEIKSNEKATTTTFYPSEPIAFIPEIKQIALGEKSTIIEANLSMSALDTDETYTNVITHGKDTLLRVDNKTGTLQITVNGQFYSLCNASGNLYTVGANGIPVVAIVNKTAGTVRYVADRTFAYYLDGTTVTNTCEAVAIPYGFTEPFSVGAMGNVHGTLTVSDVTSRNISSDKSDIIGSQMSGIHNSARIVASVDSLYYSAVGFRTVYGNGTTKEWKTSVVYTSITALDKTVTAESLGVSYLSCFAINGLDKAKNGDTFTVIPLVYIGDKVIEGEAVNFTVNLDESSMSFTANN